MCALTVGGRRHRPRQRRCGSGTSGATVARSPISTPISPRAARGGSPMDGSCPWRVADAGRTAARRASVRASTGGRGVGPDHQVEDADRLSIHLDAQLTIARNVLVDTPGLAVAGACRRTMELELNQARCYNISMLAGDLGRVVAIAAVVACATSQPRAPSLEPAPAAVTVPSVSEARVEETDEYIGCAYFPTVRAEQCFRTRNPGNGCANQPCRLVATAYSSSPIAAALSLSPPRSPARSWSSSTAPHPP